MRAAGMRPVQVWVPDVRTAKFAEQASSDSRAVNAADAQDDILSWLDEHSALWDSE